MSAPSGKGGEARHLALATDGDGTLMFGDRLGRETARALQRLKESGRRLILVTGEGEKEVGCFPRAELFDLIVAENGGLLLLPGRTVVLGPPPPPELVRELRRRRVPGVKVRRVAVAAGARQEAAFREALAALGLNYRLLFNRGDLLALPPGVDKGTGLAAALRELGLTPERAVGVGDGENDLDLLAACGFGVAVANALPALKQQADHVTRGRAGRGVVEIVARLLEDDLAAWRALSPRCHSSRVE